MDFDPRVIICTLPYYFGLYVLYSFRSNFPYEDMLLQKIYSTFFCFVLLRA